ncbi:MAG: ATP-binding protein [Desulfobacula sp.]|nr:ATP-binding protein [Desulfobacula sp.]
MSEKPTYEELESRIRELEQAESERKQTQEALAQAHNLMRYVIEHDNSAVAVLDRDLRYVYVSQRYLKDYRVKEKDIIGKYHYDIFPDIPQKIRDIHQRALAGEVLRSDRDPFHRMDGTIDWTRWECRPWYETDQSIGGIILYTEVITRYVENEEHLHQAQKMEAIGVLAGGIAHDFNNILFPIVGHTEMLLDDIPKDSPLRGSLNQIHSGALRATDLVRQILSFSRQEKNELAMMKIQPIIKEVLKLIRSTIPATIAISRNLQSTCGPVKADPTQIHQIVMNLSTNAYHAMAENGGELKIGLKEIELDRDSLINPDLVPGLYACLTVSDTGTGMNQETIGRIFDPFFTTKEKGKGTGMGLAVVHGIVKSMNGAIQVHSEPGRGTEFNVYLPVVGKIAENRPSLIKESLPKGSERILLVDDEEAIAAMEKQILERLGYHVIACTGSIEALELFRTNPDQYDLVITDMSMPKMPGDKLAVELIGIRPDISILVCTGFSETLTPEKIESIGIKGLLMKPIIIKDLAKKLRELFE